ncbi:MAG: polysaccharide export protein [Sphingomonadaceae bacterium]|nr:polysaccharide export protein [Sphingomonadaceae bacterium]
MISFFRFALAIAATVSLAACATDRSVGGASTIEATDLDELPAPTGEGIYLIGPQERLEITVAGEPENSKLWSGTYLTDDEGRLSFPYLGQLDFGGKEPSVAARLIESGLRGRYLVDPQVRVIPEDLPVPSISVGGQVDKPGAYPAVGKPTLLRVVNLAGGLNEYAQLDDVLVLRSVAGQNYIGVYNIGGIQRGNYPDPLLYANDVVIVGDSPQRRRLDNILQFVPLLSSSAILIDRLGR